MNRNRAQSLKRRIVLETLETRETPATMGLAASWANSLRAAAIAADGANAGVAVANPPSTNITTAPDGTLNPPGNPSPDGMSTTNAIQTGNQSGVRRSTNLTRGPGGLFNAPGTVSPDGMSITNSLRTGNGLGGVNTGARTGIVGGVGGNSSVGTGTGGVTPRLPSSSRFSSQFLRFGAGTTGGGGVDGGLGGVGAGSGVTIPSTSNRFSNLFLRSGPVGGSVVTSPGTVTGGGIDFGGSGGGSVSTPGVTTPSVTARFTSNFLRSGSPGSLATPGVTVPSVTVPSVDLDPNAAAQGGTGFTF